VNVFLEKLGLTEYEAKTLSALFKLKEAEAPEVSRSAQVPKTRVYDVLDRLTKKTLIIEIHGRPKRYMAIEPEKVFNTLMQEKRNELESLEKEANQLKSTISFESANGQTEKVMKVKDKNDFMKILGQHIDTATTSVHALTPIAKEHSLLKESLRNASNRNVEIKLISKVNESDPKLTKEFSQAGAKIKEFDHGVNAYIIDDKKIVMAISDFQQERPEYHFTIWPDNKPMAVVLKKYFDHAWSEGKPV